MYLVDNVQMSNQARVWLDGGNRGHHYQGIQVSSLAILGFSLALLPLSVSLCMLYTHSQLWILPYVALPTPSSPLLSHHPNSGSHYFFRRLSDPPATGIICHQATAIQSHSRCDLCKHQYDHVTLIKHFHGSPRPLGYRQTLDRQ